MEKGRGADYKTSRRGSAVQFQPADLLRLALEAFDAAGIPDNYDSAGPRVLALRRLLKVADKIDSRPVKKGNLRLIQDVYRDYRKRHTSRNVQLPVRAPSQRVAAPIAGVRNRSISEAFRIFALIRTSAYWAPTTPR